MNYPAATTDELPWIEWVNSVAPHRGHCHAGLHQDLRFLANIRDRRIAGISAMGLVAKLGLNGKELEAVPQREMFG